MKKTAYRSYMKLIVVVIIQILIFQGGSKIFASDKNSPEEGQLTYYIETAEDFNNIRTTPSAIYIVMNDINMAQYENWEPINSFSGTLDGKGHTIKGLKINKGLHSLGLFGENLGTIKHLIVESPQISCKEAQAGTTNVGVIAGKNIGLIEDVFVKDINLDIKEHAFLGKVVGGLVGENTGTVQHCHARGKIKGRVVGGLVGKNWSLKNGTLGIIERSSFIGTVESNSCMGGLVGNNVGKVENCFSQVSLRVPSGEKAFYVGGIAGDNEGDISYCYTSVWIGDNGKRIEGKISGVAPVRNTPLKDTLFYDKETMGVTPNTESGEGKITTLMKFKATYVEVGWNFKSIWEIVDGEGYPSLRKPGNFLPDEEGDIEELKNPDEEEDIEEPENPDKEEDIEEPGNPNEPEDAEESGDSQEKDSPKATEPPIKSQEPEAPRKESSKRPKSQKQRSTLESRKLPLVDDEKEIRSYFIKPENKGLREALVKHYLSKVVSQMFISGKSLGILTLISEYYILEEK